MSWAENAITLEDGEPIPDVAIKLGKFWMFGLSSWCYTVLYLYVDKDEIK